MSELARYVDCSGVKGYYVERVLMLVLAWAGANSVGARALLDSLALELERSGLLGRAVRVAEARVGEFEGYLESAGGQRWHGS